MILREKHQALLNRLLRYFEPIDTFDELDIPNLMAQARIRRPLLFKTWIKWSYGNPKEFLPPKMMKGGIGAGEKMFAWEIGGESVGCDQASHDVLALDGKIWEVKACSKETGTISIMPGKGGAAAYARVKHEIEDVIRQLQNAEWILVKNWPNCADTITEFLRVDAPMIMRGGISKGRMLGNTSRKSIGLLQVLSIARDILVDHPGDSYMIDDRLVGGGTYVRIKRLLGEEPHRVLPADLLHSELTHPAFEDPDAFIDRVWNIKASDVFGHIDGMVIARPSRYFVIPIEDIDKYLSMSCVTMGRARFEFHEIRDGTA